MSIRQGIRKAAINKRGAKYKKKYAIIQTARTSNGRQTTRYAYIKKVYINGKARYYYA